MKRRELFRKSAPLALLPLSGILAAEASQASPDGMTVESVVAELESLADDVFIAFQHSPFILDRPYDTFAFIAHDHQDALWGLRLTLVEKFAIRRQVGQECILHWRFGIDKIRLKVHGENWMARTRLAITG